MAQFFGMKRRHNNQKKDIDGHKNTGRSYIDTKFAFTANGIVRVEEHWECRKKALEEKENINK